MAAAAGPVHRNPRRTSCLAGSWPRIPGTAARPGAGPWRAPCPPSPAAAAPPLARVAPSRRRPWPQPRARVAYGLHVSSGPPATQGHAPLLLVALLLLGGELGLALLLLCRGARSSLFLALPETRASVTNDAHKNMLAGTSVPRRVAACHIRPRPCCGPSSPSSPARVRWFGGVSVQRARPKTTGQTASLPCAAACPPQPAQQLPPHAALTGASRQTPWLDTTRCARPLLLLLEALGLLLGAAPLLFGARLGGLVGLRRGGHSGLGCTSESEQCTAHTTAQLRNSVWAARWGSCRPRRSCACLQTALACARDPPEWAVNYAQLRTHCHQHLLAFVATSQALRELAQIQAGLGLDEPALKMKNAFEKAVVDGETRGMPARCRA